MGKGKRHKKGRGQSPKKALIRQCTWCKKILKAGSYQTVHNEAFCGDTCLSEWQTRQNIIHRKVDGQKAPIPLHGVKVGEVYDSAAPAVPPGEGLPRLMTVAEFLEGRSDREIEELAARLADRNKPRQHPWLTPYNIVLVSLLLLITGLALVLNHRKNHYYTVALANKHNAEKLASALQSLSPASVSIDTSGLRVDTRIAIVNNGRSRDSLSAFREVTPLPFSRQIDYGAGQRFVPNQYSANLNFSRGDFHKKQVALTFDGAAHSQETNAILDTLKSRGVRATMFLTRDFILRSLGLVRRMASEGHVVGNHTATHPHLTTLERNGLQETTPGVTREYLETELKKVQEACAQNNIALAPIWRAPYGETNRAINAWAEGLGLKHIGWTQGTTWRTTMDTNDWVVSPGDKGFFHPQEVIEKLLRFGKGTAYGLNGGIILMHLGTLRKEGKMVTALGTLIDSLRNRGYEFVTVPQMLEAAGAPAN